MTQTETRRRPLLFGRRKGPKPSARQERLRDHVLPRLRLEPVVGRDPAAYFAAAVSDVWFEVGFGGGEHLVWQAEHHPAVGMIGAEPYEAGTAKLLSHLEDLRAQGKELRNIRVYEGDARDVLAGMPPASVGRVFILFPDPWPKTRHHKRRFVQSDLLDVLARVMREGAELRFATDDAGYLRWTLERVVAHPAFKWTAEGVSDWTTRPPDWPQTRYEAKALHGPPAYLCFLRR